MNGIDIFEKRCFIIAEAGVNHNGSLELAKKLIDAAVEAGADAIKFQTFKAESLVTSKVEKASYQRENTGKKEETQLEMLKGLELRFEDFGILKKYCDKQGIVFLSTPFDFESVDILEPLVPAYKIASGEITNIPLLKYVASKRKPMIISTGMSTLGEIEEALEAISEIDPNIPKILLHCTTNYPTPYEDVNLKAMLTLQEVFKLPVGYSDHTLGIEVPIAAVALGAKIIEKHFTLDKTLPGPDHKASLEPHEFKAMVNSIRNIEKALGDGRKQPTTTEKEIMSLVRKSLVASRSIKKGEVIKECDIEIKRPGTGISPKFKDIIVGMKVTRDIEKDTPFDWSFFKEDKNG